MLYLVTTLMVAGNATGQARWKLECSALSFDRSYLAEPALLSKVRAAGNLSGRSGPQDNTKIHGWFEYDFSVPKSGWYEVFVPPSTDGYEFLLDDKTYVYGESGSTKAGNFFLTKGRHTLHIQSFIWWHGFGPIAHFTVQESGPALAQRVRVHMTNPFVRGAILRRGATLELDIAAGGLAQPSKLTVWVKSAETKAAVSQFEVEIPPSKNLFTSHLSIPCTTEGVFRVEFGDNDKPIAASDLPPISFSVVDTTLQPRPGGEAKKTLLQEIDCVATPPEYFGGGTTWVVHKSFGAYRESADIGWYGHMNSTEPSWFAYKFSVPEAQRPYLIEVDYPDDALRTFCIAVREAGPGSYPVTAGVDSGGEFPLSNRLQMQSILCWPRDRDLRLLFITATSGERAAATRIRIYQIDGGLPALNVPVRDGRSFGNWYEEGSSFLAMYGGPDSNHAGLKDYLACADRWAQSVAHMRGDTLWPALAIYQFGLYPSRYNVSFTGPFTIDLAEIILLKGEKYGLKTLFDFHPEARELAFPLPDETSSRDSFLVNKEGVVGNTYPYHFCPVFPRNQQWYMGMISEFVDRYQHSPAFQGISLRQMSFVNPCLNNFQSLDWGYGDYTVHLFEKETGLHIPIKDDDPQRFRKRYDWLMASARAQWIAWRCQQITELYRKAAARVRQARPDLLIYTGILDANVERAKEAGEDPQRLAALPGVRVVNGAGYGRRPDMHPEQNRDEFLATLLNPVCAPNDTSAFLFGSVYFEATEVVVPPESLGFPAGTRRTWMSGVVNPAGRNYLERWALAVAQGDATFLSDGGNAYTLGQPLLREFLQEYRCLPDAAFVSRADAVDPVTVRELRRPKDFLFYLVNCERVPVQVALRLKTDSLWRRLVGRVGPIRRLSSGEAAALENGVLRVELKPYQLLSFAAPPGTRIESVTTVVPVTERDKIKAQVQWLTQLAEDVSAGKAGERLTPNQRTELKTTLLEVQTTWQKGWLWHTRALIERLAMVRIYESCIRFPPYLRDDGPPVAPADALRAKELLQRAVSTEGLKIAPSESLAPDWVGDTVLVCEDRPLQLRLEIPVAGQYRLTVGSAAGSAQGTVNVIANGQDLGTLADRRPEPHGATDIVPHITTLPQGPATVELRTQPRKRIAISYLEVTPVFTDILRLRWMAIGPFPGNQQDPAKSLATVFIPEEKREFDVAVPLGDGNTARWQALVGFEDFIDLSFGKPPAPGTIAYAVTHIYSPTARRVRLSYGMDYWIKIWLNGKLVKDYEPHTGGAPGKGQFTADADLEEGWNELLLKAASGSLGDGFWMAISNPNDLRFAARAE